MFCKVWTYFLHLYFIISTTSMASWAVDSSREFQPCACLENDKITELLTKSVFYKRKSSYNWSEMMNESNGEDFFFFKFHFKILISKSPSRAANVKMILCYLLEAHCNSLIKFNVRIESLQWGVSHLSEVYLTSVRRISPQWGVSHLSEAYLTSVRRISLRWSVSHLSKAYHRPRAVELLSGVLSVRHMMLPSVRSSIKILRN